LRLLWLALSLGALVVAQFAFTGEQTSEVAGNLTFFMLVLCAPLSLLGYLGMFLVFDFFQSFGLYPYNSRLALSAVWGVYFLVGLVQWFVLPLSWPRKPNNRLVRTPETTRHVS
jgi:hypothetical protein